MTTDRFIRQKEVTKLCGLPCSTIYRLMNQGDFPRQVRLSQRTVAWRESEILAWIETRQTAA